MGATSRSIEARGAGSSRACVKTLPAAEKAATLCKEAQNQRKRPQSAWLVASGARPGTPEIWSRNRVFGRPKIVKDLTFWLSDPTFEPGIGTGMAENPPYLILRSGG